MRRNYPRQIHHRVGADPLAMPSRVSPRNAFYQNNFRTRSGYIERVYDEPEFEVVMVDIRLPTGEIIGPALYPGPAVTANMAGRYGGNIAGLHGLWTPPAIGQQVTFQFGEGNATTPVVVQVHSYRTRPDFADPSLHTLPITKQGHSTKDVILGHWTGSYFVIRNQVPLPGQIESYSRSSQTHEAKIAYKIKCAQFSVELTSGEKLEFLPGQFKLSLPTGNEIVLDPTKMEVTTSGIVHKLNATGISTDGNITWDANSVPTTARTHVHPSAPIGAPSSPTPGS